ncbi:type II toxin-antitoxin system RelE/ParE family toxin [Thalassobaculum litoreum]|uniref:Toxin ParE1/3/4 n=1 Tax=Thalassobaculum litoreum DSM 18839 TaxID=1123362 RepID=A0A8G2BK02_9PROT|nr:type II toxin-antitoxin system RelE/ParE family toxin [Thalassobaculum litoreum]SDG14249.1 toxin ParE1/3/4 [Thalassobaculum litoreum DSM 18839]
MEYKLSRQARTNIKDIARYTKRYFGDDQTQEYLGGLYYSFELLAENPKLGREWSEGKRRYVYRMHIVYYRLTPSGPLITEVRHTAMA